MKTLYMVRHAKSSWKHDVIDHQRPLKSRGSRDAELVSEYVKDKVKKPQRLFTSDAERALSTALYFKEAFGLEDSEFITNHNLYDFGGRQVLEKIGSQAEWAPRTSVAAGMCGSVVWSRYRTISTRSASLTTVRLTCSTPLVSRTAISTRSTRTPPRPLSSEAPA